MINLAGWLLGTKIENFQLNSIEIEKRTQINKVRCR